MRCFLWLLPLGAARSLRVALQVSGHLRSMCANESHFEAFASMVDDCRRVLDCDVFLHTWSTTEATTSTWHDRDPPPATPSTPCVARLDARLGFAGSAVEDQRVAEGQWRRLAKRGWLDPQAPVRFADTRAAKESEIPNFKGSYLGRFPLVSAGFWTSDRLSERSRSMDAFSGTRARGTLTLKRR